MITGGDDEERLGHEVTCQSEDLFDEMELSLNTSESARSQVIASIVRRRGQ